MPDSKPGRNDPCLCGSGKKYKQCCGRLASAPQGERAVPAARAGIERPVSVEGAELAALLQQGRFAEIERRARAGIERQPGSGTNWKALAVSLQLQSKNALVAARKAAELLPLDAEAHYSLGLALLDAQRLEEAAASLRRALSLAPDYLSALAALGGTLQALGQTPEAVACYRRVLAADPALAEIHCSLGNALNLLGQPEDAAASLRRALQLAPDSPVALTSLGNVLVGLGQLNEAEACYRRALSLLPNRAELHSNLARVLLDMGRVDAAIAEAQRALKIDPNLPEAHENLAGALLNINFEEAVAHYRRALQFRPDDAELNHRLGAALRLQGRTSDAEAYCRRALELSPDYAPAIATLAEACADRGDFAGAESLFKQALALDGNLSEVWVGQSRLRRFTRDDAQWLEQAERAAERARQPREAIALRYAIGKYFDDIGEFDQAFGHYRLANQLSKQHTRPYDRNQVTRQVDSLTTRYPRVVPLAEAKVTTRAVLIVGMPRSGTSLAEQILASHQSAFGVGELNFWHAASAALREVGLSDSGRIRRLGADYERLLAKLSNDASRVVDKMPTNFLELGLVLSALPGTRVIHMQRDPIDTCLSIYFQDFRSTLAYANDLESLVHFYSEYERLMQHWRSALPAGVLLEVPYEGLVDDQEAWTRRMLQFIDLPWDPACLEFHKTQRSVVTASKWQVRQRIHRASVARWRHYQAHIAPLLALVRPA